MRTIFVRFVFTVEEIKDDASGERTITGGWRKCVTDSEMLIVSFDRFGEHGSRTQSEIIVSIIHYRGL